MTCELNVEDAIIKQLPIRLLELIGLYNPLFLELKNNLKDKINWRYMITELFDIPIGELKAGDGFNNFMHLTTVKRDKMTYFTMDLIREYRIAKSDLLIKNVIAGPDFYIVILTNNTIRIIDTNFLNTPQQRNNIYYLSNIQSIIQNNYYTVIKTCGKIWCCGIYFVRNCNIACFELENTPTNISLISSDKYNIFVLLTDGSVEYLPVARKYNGPNMRNYQSFIPLKLAEICIDIISINIMTIFQLANGKIFTSTDFYTNNLLVEITNFTFSRDNVLKLSGNYLLLLHGGEIYWDSGEIYFGDDGIDWDGFSDKRARFSSDLINAKDIKKMEIVSKAGLIILFFLMSNGDLYYINVDDKELKIYPISNVVDICFDYNQYIIKTKMGMYNLIFDAKYNLLDAINCYEGFVSPVVNFIGKRIRLLDGTIIKKIDNHSMCSFHEKIIHMDIYAEHPNGSFIFTRGNYILFEMDNNLLTCKMVLENDQYGQYWNIYLINDINDFINYPIRVKKIVEPIV